MTSKTGSREMPFGPRRKRLMLYLQAVFNSPATTRTWESRTNRQFDTNPIWACSFQTRSAVPFDLQHSFSPRAATANFCCLYARLMRVYCSGSEYRSLKYSIKEKAMENLPDYIISGVTPEPKSLLFQTRFNSSMSFSHIASASSPDSCIHPHV